METWAQGRLVNYMSLAMTARNMGTPAYKESMPAPGRQYLPPNINSPKKAKAKKEAQSFTIANEPEEQIVLINNLIHHLNRVLWQALLKYKKDHGPLRW